MSSPTYPIGIDGGASGADEKVKVSISDTIASYLSSSIGAHSDTPIALNILNPGANEVLELELDGDQVHIDWVPIAFTRNASPTEAGDINDLTAYLKGIDDEFLASGGSELNQRLKVEKIFNAAYDDHYTELSYTGDNLTKVEIWEDVGKAIKLFTRDLAYTGDNLTSVTTTDELTTVVLTATLTYDGDSLDTVTKVVV